MGQWILKLFLIIPVALIVIFLMVKYEERKDRKRIEKIFEGREQLSTDEFYIRHYQDQGVPKEIVVGVVKVLEEYLGTDLSRLQPTDSFSGNLSYFLEIDDMADVEIVKFLEDHFAVKISDDEAHNTHTIDDIIQLVWRKVREA